jgi:hypothetical protein
MEASVHYVLGVWLTYLPNFTKFKMQLLKRGEYHGNVTLHGITQDVSAVKP